MRFRTFIAIVIVPVLIAYFYKLQRDQEFVTSLSQQTNVTGAFTPREGVEEATRIAKLWDRDCFLQCVRIAFPVDGDQDNRAITFEGRPIPPCGWTFRFFSPRRRQFLRLVMRPDGSCEAEVVSSLNYLKPTALPDDFLDSPEVFQIAEESFGRDFRQDKDVFRMYAQLTTWPSNVGGPEDPVLHRSNWQIHYLATQDSKTRTDLFLMLDAVTGELLTAQRSVDTEMELIYNAFEKK